MADLVVQPGARRRNHQLCFSRNTPAVPCRNRYESFLSQASQPGFSLTTLYSIPASGSVFSRCAFQILGKMTADCGKLFSFSQKFDGGLKLSTPSLPSFCSLSARTIGWPPSRRDFEYPSRIALHPVLHLSRTLPHRSRFSGLPLNGRGHSCRATDKLHRNRLRPNISGPQHPARFRNCSRGDHRPQGPSVHCTDRRRQTAIAEPTGKMFPGGI